MSLAFGTSQPRVINTTITRDPLAEIQPVSYEPIIDNRVTSCCHILGRIGLLPTYGALRHPRICGQHYREGYCTHPKHLILLPLISPVMREGRARLCRAQRARRARVVRSHGLRRNVSKGQQAMALAILYREARKGRARQQGVTVDSSSSNTLPKRCPFAFRVALSVELGRRRRLGLKVVDHLRPT